MILRDAALELSQIGARLNASHLLESAIRADGDRLRVTTKLIDAPQQHQIWAAAYDGPRDGLLAFQQEVSDAVSAQVRSRFAPDTVRIGTGRHTANEAAFDRYLRGRFSGNRYVSTSNQEAIGHFAAATALDPGYALAWAGMAETYGASPVNGDMPAATVWRPARHAAEMALRAAPLLAEAHAAMGFVRFWLDWDWLAAEADFRRATQLDPNYAFAHRMLGIALSHLGRHEAAAAAMRRAVQLDPLYAMHHALSAMLAFQAGDYAAGVAFGRRAISVDARFWIGHFQLAQSLEQAGAADEALAVLQDAVGMCGNSTKPLMLRGYILARQGRRSEAEALLATLAALARERFVPPYAAALIHAGLGDGDAAIAALEGGLAVRDVNLAFLPLDPKWHPFRADPRFADIVERCGFALPPPAQLPVAAAEASLQTIFSSPPWRRAPAVA
jgi:tetratricopeptide (TPR) repeat protein